MLKVNISKSVDRDRFNVASDDYYMLKLSCYIPYSPCLLKYYQYITYICQYLIVDYTSSILNLSNETELIRDR
jgi:hypothetical protein